ncbi:MAG TPA: hypothetical protein ENK80_03950, partial [Rhodobacterales bacterium]|nr:hypothetical protein [Rhodobacterales bacterium]
MKAGLALCAALLLAACAAPPTGKMLTMRAERHIDAAPEAVWARSADPLTEHALRRERLTFEANGPLQVGTIYTETISVGLRNGYTMKVQVADLAPGRRVLMVSPRSWPRRFTADRVFTPEGGGTRMIYTVEAEDHVVRDLSVLQVPLWLAKTVYQADM